MRVVNWLLSPRPLERSVGTTQQQQQQQQQTSSFSYNNNNPYNRAKIRPHRLNAEALPKFQIWLGKSRKKSGFQSSVFSLATMSYKINLNFDKPTFSKGILDLLSNELQEDPDRDVMKTSLKESLAILAKGNKLQYGPANNLLASILKALSLEDSNDDDEIAPATLPGSQEELSAQNPSQGPSSGPEPGSNTATPVQKDKRDPNHKKEKRDLCRFFARGRCNRSKDCRFDHPSICKKFRQFGSLSSDPKGCDGKCNGFHPNACRNSLRNKTCSFSDCRFYHLKGTKMTSRDSRDSPDRGRNWDTNKGQNHSQNLNQGKNSRPNQRQTNNRHQNQNKTGSKPDPSNKGNPTPGSKPGPVFQQDQPELVATLQEIMKRLSVMEARQSMIPQMLTPAHHVTPLLSPAVPQPGSQTQHQWASPNQWTQSQY